MLTTLLVAFSLFAAASSSFHYYQAPQSTSDTTLATIEGSILPNSWVAKKTAITYVASIDDLPIDSAKKNLIQPVLITPDRHTIEVLRIEDGFFAYGKFTITIASGDRILVKTLPGTNKNAFLQVVNKESGEHISTPQNVPLHSMKDWNAPVVL